MAHKVFIPNAYATKNRLLKDWLRFFTRKSKGYFVNKPKIRSGEQVAPVILNG